MRIFSYDYFLKANENVDQPVVTNFSSLTEKCSPLFDRIFKTSNDEKIIQDFYQKNHAIIFGFSQVYHHIVRSIEKRVVIDEDFYLIKDERNNYPLIGKNDWIISFKNKIVNEPAVKEMIKEGRDFYEARKKGEIDLDHTHIPFLCSAIENNFFTLFPEDEMDLLDPITKDDVKKFKIEMRHRIETKSITYNWWISFNFRLSIAATRFEDRFELENNLISSGLWKDHNSFLNSELLSYKEYFLFPTTLGTIDINDLNKLFGEKVWAIGLIKKPVIADGRFMSPMDFFLHDLGHFQIFKLQKALYTISEKELICIKEKFFQMRFVLLSLNNENSQTIISLVKLLDFAFFYMTHEGLNLSNLKAWVNQSFNFENLIFNLFKMIERMIDYIFLGESRFIHPLKMTKFDQAIFQEAVPDPKELGFSSYGDVYGFGFELLELFLKYEAIPDVLRLKIDINKLLKKLSSQKSISSVRSDFYDNFLTNENQINAYVKIINLINNEKYIEADKILTEIKNSDPILYGFLSKMKMDKSLDYWLSYKDPLSEKINRIMDFIDGSYIHSN